jgi:hypothetical protein
MVLLGNIGEIQKVCEGARNRQGFFNRHRAQFERELVEGIYPLRRLARGLGDGAHTLNALEQHVPFLTAERLAQERPKQPHVVTQRLVGVLSW